MPLDIPINITEIKNDSEAIPTKTYKIDFENGRIIGKVDELEAIKQFIKKALKTPRFKCLIYDSQYGSEIDNLIKSDSTFQFIESELPRVVEDALIYDQRIQKVYDFSFELSNEQLYIKFKVDTIYGTTEYEEAI